MTENTTQHAHEMNKDGKGSYAEVHGLKMYYEIHGEGFPLVLLHGGLSTIDTSFGKVLPGLAGRRQVIAIEQQAHGHTADSDRPLTYQWMANDTIALLSHIGIECADFFGYSIGAGIAIEIAIEHPKVVRKLVVATPIFTADGFQPGGPRRDGGSPTRTPGWVPVPGGLRKVRAESARLAPAHRQNEATGSGVCGLAVRGHCLDQGTHSAHRWGLGYCPSRARGRDVSTARRRRLRRSRRPPECTTRCAPRHHSYHARGSRRLAGSHDYGVPRRAQARVKVPE